MGIISIPNIGVTYLYCFIKKFMNKTFTYKTCIYKNIKKSVKKFGEEEKPLFKIMHFTQKVL